LWSPEEWQVGSHLERILGDNKWWFRTAGPPWFFLLLRTIGAVVSSIEKLSTKVNVSEVFKTMVDADEVAVLKARPETKGEPLSTTKLHVSVKENGESIVEVTLPAQAVDDLESLISPETAKKIAEQGLNLHQIKLSAQKSDYAPQVLFEAQIGNRSYKVYLKS
jgi:hypothetical protein